MKTEWIFPFPNVVYGFCTSECVFNGKLYAVFRPVNTLFLNTMRIRIRTFPFCHLMNTFFQSLCILTLNGFFVVVVVFIVDDENTETVIFLVNLFYAGPANAERDIGKFWIMELELNFLNTFFFCIKKTFFVWD